MIFFIVIEKKIINLFSQHTPCCVPNTLLQFYFSLQRIYILQSIRHGLLVFLQIHCLTSMFLGRLLLQLAYFLSFLTKINFTSWPQFTLPPILPSSHPRIPSIHTSSVSVQKGGGLPWVSTKHSISSCGKNKPIPLY